MSGFLIEYAAYPIPYLRSIQDKDLKDGMRLRTRMLATGIILFDRSGAIQQLQKGARQLLKKKLPGQSAELTEMHKYYLWDQLDNLQDIRRQRTLVLLTPTMRACRIFSGFMPLSYVRKYRVQLESIVSSLILNFGNGMASLRFQT